MKIINNKEISLAFLGDLVKKAYLCKLKVNNRLYGYSGDADMQYILHRLLMAATDADVRQDMNVEDEYYSVIEKRDTEILIRDRKLAEQKVEIEQQKTELKQQKTELEQKDAMLRTSIQALLNSGKTLEGIAAIFGKSPQELKGILGAEP